MDFKRQSFGIGSLACYENFEQVGEGTYGHVYRANDKRDGEVVALKRLIFHKESGGFPLCAVREIKFLKSLSHQNIVKLKDIATSKGCEHLDTAIINENSKVLIDGESNRESKDHQMKISQSCGNLYLVFEYVEHDLGGLIDAKFKFNSISIKTIIRQLFAVLDYLDEKKIIHRDIKSSNILISNRHQVKLADFGLARSSIACDGSEGKMDLTNNVVTMWYKPPELLLGAVRYTPAVDMWSAGCVLAELELARPMLPGKTEVEQLELICRVMGTPTEATWPGISSLPNFESLLAGMAKFTTTFRSSYEKKLSEGVLGLLERVLSLDPSRRSSARLALAHRFFFTSPTPPADPTELVPLALPPGTSLHEFQTKQQRKQKDEEARAAAAAAANPSRPPVSLQPTFQPHNYSTLAANGGGDKVTGISSQVNMSQLSSMGSMGAQYVPSSSSSPSSSAAYSPSSVNQQFGAAMAYNCGRDDVIHHGGSGPHASASWLGTGPFGVADAGGVGGVAMYPNHGIAGAANIEGGNTFEHNFHQGQHEHTQSMRPYQGQTIVGQRFSSNLRTGRGSIQDYNSQRMDHGAAEGHHMGHMIGHGEIGSNSAQFIPQSMPQHSHFIKPSDWRPGGESRGGPLPNITQGSRYMHPTEIMATQQGRGQPLYKQPSASGSFEGADIMATQSRGVHTQLSSQAAAPFAGGSRQQYHQECQIARGDDCNQSYRGGLRGGWIQRGGRHHQERGHQFRQGGRVGRWTPRDQPRDQPHDTYEQQQQQPHNKDYSQQVLHHHSAFQDASSGGGDAVGGKGEGKTVVDRFNDHLAGHKRPLALPRQDPS